MTDSVEPVSAAKAEPASKKKAGNGAATAGAPEAPSAPATTGAPEAATTPATTSAPAATAVVAPAVQSAPSAAARTSSEAHNVLIPKGVWPPPIYIRNVADEGEKWFMEHRWHAQWDWYDKKATYFKKRHQRIQLVIGVAAGIVPALVAINSPDATMTNVLKVVTITLSLIVTTFTVWENVYKHGDMWRSFRGAAEELAREKSLYDMRAGPYRKVKQPYDRFVERTEQIIAKQNGQWLNAQTAEEVEKSDKTTASKSANDENS